MNDNGEGLPLFSLHVEPVGSLCGLFVGLLFECRPSVRPSQVRLSLGGGSPKRPVVIVGPFPVKALTALISGRRMGLVRGLITLPLNSC